MSKHISRRKALATGAASAGLVFGAVCSKSEQEISSKSSQKPFLYPWSPPEEVERDLTPGKTLIRLACSAYHVGYQKEINITEMVKRVRDAGYTSCEGDDSWKNASDSEVRELKEALKKYDVIMYDLHICINNIDPDLSKRQKNIRRTIENIETAERLGLPMVTTHVGSCSSVRPTCPHRDNWAMETWKTSVKVMKQIIRDTAGCKVDLGVEALNPTNINNPRAHLKLQEDVGDPRIKVTFDPQNMININTYYRTTELLNESFELLGENIIAAHAKELLLAPDQMNFCYSWVMPGKGTMDFELYLVSLSRLSYPRSLLLEFLSKEQYPEAKKFIEETAARVGVKIYT